MPSLASASYSQTLFPRTSKARILPSPDAKKIFPIPLTATTDAGQFAEPEATGTDQFTVKSLTSAPRTNKAFVKDDSDPLSSATVRVTLNIPADAKVNDACAPSAVVPSGNIHFREVTSPSSSFDSSMNVTESPALTESGEYENAATGGTFAARTLTTFSAVALLPSAPQTVSLTVYSPGVLYRTGSGLASSDQFPSPENPKCQKYLSTSVPLTSVVFSKLMYVSPATMSPSTS